jgi:L-asparaginase / beta-aspartyl-peptidase
MPDDMVEAHLHGVNNALAAGWRVLERGGAALDAVEEAVVIMEDDETFDAGRGSFLNRDGKVQLDALIMDGATLRAGGVGCVERLRNPVRAARKILSESPHVYFVAEGAERFAAEHGLALCKNEDLIIPREVDRLKKYQIELAQREAAGSTATISSPHTTPQSRTTQSAQSRSTPQATSPPRRRQEAR